MMLSLVSTTSCATSIETKTENKKTLACDKEKIYNNTGRELDVMDKKQIEISKKECKRRYKRSPCLSRMWIGPNHSYKVACGSEKKVK